MTGYVMETPICLVNVQMVQMRGRKPVRTGFALRASGVCNGSVLIIYSVSLSPLCVMEMMIVMMNQMKERSV